MSRQLIITGMHRSGTSAVARLFHAAGLFLGEEFLPAAESNVRGHFEDTEVVDLHQRLLKAENTSWLATHPVPNEVPRRLARRLDRLIANRESNHNQWGFKDPRACLFLPMWKHALPDVAVVAVYRHPAAVAESLRRRRENARRSEPRPDENLDRLLTDPDLPLSLWANYNNALLRFADEHPQDATFVSFAAVLEGFPLVEAVVSAWGFDLEPVGGAIEEALVTHPDSPEVPPDIAALWDRLQARNVAIG